MLLINASEIRKLLPMNCAIDCVEAAFAATTAGDTNTPLRTRINAEDGTFLFMPTYSPKAGAAALKTISIYPYNAEKGLPTAPATVQVIDGDTGIPLALMDGDALTRLRTGASTGAAMRHLANPSSRIAVLVGTGGQAATQALAMITALPELTELRIVNPIYEDAERFASELQLPAGFGGKITTWDNADEAAKDADVITLVTSSTKPVLSARNLKPGVTISCVGSYQPHMQECGSDIIARADLIVCDHVESALAESGDLIIPIDEGVIDRSQVITELGGVISGQQTGRTSGEQVIVYETVGVAAQDLWAAQEVLTQAQRAGVGTNWDPTA